MICTKFADVVPKPPTMLHRIDIYASPAYETNGICDYIQRNQSGPQAILSPCVVRIQHAQDCSQLTGTLISSTLPHSNPLNMSHRDYHDAIGILDILRYNSCKASLPSECLSLGRYYKHVAIYNH